MTAPSAPGVALYEGCFGVTRGPDEKGGEVVGPLYEVQPSMAYAWSVEGRSSGQWAEDGEDGYAPAGAKESPYDLISVHPTREKAEAWLRAYRDAQDRATAVPARSTTAEWSPEGEGGSIIVGKGRDAQDAEPERRRAVAEVPADDDGWGPWRTDISEWNVTTHDVRFECVGGIHKISTRPRTEQAPPPEATPTPAPDWEALARGAVECLKTVRDYVDDAHTGHLTYKRGRLDQMMTGEDLTRIDALIAAMQEKKP